MKVIKSFYQWIHRTIVSSQSVSLVGGVFLFLLITGFVWRGFYLYFIDEQFEQQQVTDQLVLKSTALENILISMRNRSVYLSEMLYSVQDTPHFNEILQRFNAAAESIITSYDVYQSIADVHEAHLLVDYLSLIEVNRARQDFVVDLLRFGDRGMAISEYINEALPWQEKVLSTLDKVHNYNVNARVRNSQEIAIKASLLRDVVAYTTLFYLVLFALVGYVVMKRLVYNSRLQSQLQAQLAHQLEVKTVEFDEADKELLRLARFDALTNLMNRRYFENSLTAMLGRVQQGTLLYVDLDNFKWFNDTLGHAAGDELLMSFSQAMTSANSPIDYALLGRIGSDEFAVFLPEAIEESEQIAISFLQEEAKRLDALYKPAKSLTLSIGVARYPQHGEQSDLLMRFVDMAMYEAKRQGKGRVVEFGVELLQQVYDEIDLEQALKEAIDKKQLQVFYQAQYHLKTFELTGAEALVRWQRFGQWVSPAVMVPLAEKTGLIHGLGLSVLDIALADIQHWDEQGHFVPKVAVNISAAQMRLENLHEIYAGHIMQSGVDFARIEAELTESVFADMDMCANFMAHLNQHGIHIALDDFGTGYSSLSQITRLKFNKLKIDQSFVACIETDPHMQILVKTIIQMGHNLGMTVLAEGIETVEQYRLLRDWGCDEGQGYLFARPVTADQFSFAPLQVA